MTRPRNRYHATEMAVTPTKMTDDQLKSSAVVGVLGGQKDQKKVKVEYRNPAMLIGSPHRPSDQRAGGKDSGHVSLRHNTQPIEVA